MNISVVFPAYNEERAVEETITRAISALRPQCDNFEIVIVDDGSTDATGRILERMAGQHPQIKVFRNDHNRGIAYTVLRGLKLARYELVTHNGMDYPFDLADLSKMLPLLNDADVVVGYRRAYSGYTPYRRFISAVNVMLLRSLFKLHLRDYNFTQLYKKKVLDMMTVKATSAGFIIPETLLRAYALGFKIKEVEIEYHARTSGVARAGKFSEVWGSFRDMMKFRMSAESHVQPVGQTAEI